MKTTLWLTVMGIFVAVLFSICWMAVMEEIITDIHAATGYQIVVFPYYTSLFFRFKYYLLLLPAPWTFGAIILSRRKSVEASWVAIHGASAMVSCIGLIGAVFLVSMFPMRGFIYRREMQKPSVHIQSDRFSIRACGMGVRIALTDERKWGINALSRVADSEVMLIGKLIGDRCRQLILFREW